MGDLVDRKQQAIADKNIDSSHEIDVFLTDKVLEDPSIDFELLDQLAGDTAPDVVEQAPSDAGPSRYDLSLLQREGTTSPEQCSPPTIRNEREIILEDVLSDMKLDVVESEIDMSVFDEVEEIPHDDNNELLSLAQHEQLDHLQL